MYLAGTIFRNSVLGALDAIGRPWQIALTTPSLAGMRAALRDFLTHSPRLT